MKSYKWKRNGYTEYYYEADTGRIVGEINNTTLVGPNWSVTVERDYMGHYISEEFARMAVQNQIAKNDKANEEYAKREMKVHADNERAERYLNLIYQVSSKYPNESRYETAMRYIKEAEERCQTNEGPKCA